MDKGASGRGCRFRDCSDASTNFLDQLYGGLVPGTGSFNCHWQKMCHEGHKRGGVPVPALVYCSSNFK